MADFILNRKIIKIIPVEPYPFPTGAFQIYGNGIFYNGFSIGDKSNLGNAIIDTAFRNIQENACKRMKKYINFS